MDHFSALYERLGVTLRPEDTAGESRYNDALATVVADLERVGLARPSEGAMCVFLPGFTGRDGQPVPLMVRKQDGGDTHPTPAPPAMRDTPPAPGAPRLDYVGS